jgi:alpha-1,3-mannosyltransferase
MAIKVTHVVRQYAPSIGGMEDVVRNIAAQQLQQHGHIPTVVTLDRLFTRPQDVLEPEEMVEGVRVVRLPYSGSSRYPLAPSVLKNLAQADVVHVHGVDFFYDYLAWSKPVHRKPLVASTHGGFFHTAYASRLKKIYFNSVTRMSSLAYDKVIGTSRNDGDMFSPIVSAQRLTVIENGVNVTKFGNLGSADLVPTAIYFGRWSVNKGLDETLALFARMVVVNPAWRLVIAGREYDHTEKSLLALIERHHLQQHVRLEANPSEKRLAELIGQASYYVCLSRHEGFGIAPIEGMSAGLTPLLSDIPPFRNLVTQSGHGMLLDVANIEDAARRINDAHVQGEPGHAARRQAMQDFVQRYSWDHIASQYVDIYEAALAKGKHHG